MTQTVSRPGIVLKDRKLDVTGLSRTVSALHAHAAQFGGEHYAMGPNARRIEAALANMTRRVEASVAEATEAYENPPRPIRPNPMRAMVAKAAVATMNGMVATRDAARRAASPLADPAVRRTIRQVVPGMVADAVRSDLNHINFTVREAAADAGRRAGSLARLVTSKLTHDAERVRDLFGPLAKFSQGSTVLAGGGAGPERTGRVLRALATIAIAGTVTFGVIADAKAQTRMGGGRAVVTAQAPEASIDDLFAKSFGGAARQAPVAVPGMGTPVPVARQATAPAPVHAIAPVPNLASAPPASAYGTEPVTRDAVPTAADQALRAGRRTDYSDVHEGPSRAFLDLAGASLGAHMNDINKGRDRVASLMVMATTCLHGLSPVKECRVQADGVDIDFATGVHRITQQPIQGLTTAEKPLAVESNGTLRVLDPEMMATVQTDANSFDIASGRESVGFEEPDAPEEAGVRRP